MNNLHRALAPVSDAAWRQIEEEARRTFTATVAGRRVVDVADAAGLQAAAVGTGHTRALPDPAAGVQARARESRPYIELRVPFTLRRDQIDDVERGAADADWQPVKDAATRIALAEDRIVFEGNSATEVAGIRTLSSNPALELPADPRQYPDVVSRALTTLRLTGVEGPYALLLSAEAYTAVSESVDHGYPIHSHLANLLEGDILWAPALEGALLLSTRGGDFALHLGQDLSIGYLSHDADTVQLYLQESLTFLGATAEASVAFCPAGGATQSES
ncbi:family 1 encapsulin nanocompartment shell protein [Catenulispora yoronensis]|uniref:Type 1 encapsulin shell protein n=1 Tax=Catenulispora yoronensis TaxID=450799 RepID=A0ABP5G5G1_9ACTN